VAVAALDSSNTVLAMTTSDGSGNFSLSVTYTGSGLDGYLKATNSGDEDTYLYPPGLIASDFDGADVELIPPSDISLIGELTEAQGSNNGIIGLEVLDANGSDVSGAKVTTSSGSAFYDSNGIPSKSATSTSTDGRAYIMNAAPGSVTVSATKTGTTFSSHAVTAYAGALTETIVEP
jgi:hypothetical protein